MNNVNKSLRSSEGFAWSDNLTETPTEVQYSVSDCL